MRLHDLVVADYVALLARPNVARVAVGWKERGGRVTRRISVKIYVRDKTDDLPAEHRLPKTATVLVPVGGGRYVSRRVPTDVVWHAAPSFCAASTDFLNPVASGAMLARPGAEAGTFTCVVADANGRRFGLTAGHVVRTAPGPIAPHIAVVQPPQAPANLPPGESTVVGETAGGFFGNRGDGFTDFALIAIRAGRAGSSTAIDGAPGDGPLLPWEAVVSSSIEVSKFGALTGRTDASYVGPCASIVIDGVTVTNVYEFVGTSPPLFGRKGDSGALVVSRSPDTAGAIVGVLFATQPPAPDAPAGRGYVYPFERIEGFRPI